MAEEHVHSVSGAKAVAATRVSLTEPSLLQPRVSEIEHGALDTVQLSTLRNYVHALGGHRGG